MSRIILTTALTLVVIYVVPLVVYSVFSVAAGLQPPDDVSPARFLLGILISKAGTAIAFVLLFHVAREVFGGRWLLYALLWWVMYVIGEVGQAVGPNYSWMDAIAGIISETIYWPLAAWLTNRLIGEAGTAMPEA